MFKTRWETNSVKTAFDFCWAPLAVKVHVNQEPSMSLSNLKHELWHQKYDVRSWCLAVFYRVNIHNT